MPDWFRHPPIRAGFRCGWTDPGTGPGTGSGDHYAGI